MDIVLLTFNVTFTFCKELLLWVLPLFLVPLVFVDVFYYVLLFDVTVLLTGIVLFFVLEELLVVEFIDVLDELLVVVFADVLVFVLFYTYYWIAYVIFFNDVPPEEN